MTLREIQRRHNIHIHNNNNNNNNGPKTDTPEKSEDNAFTIEKAAKNAHIACKHSAEITRICAGANFANCECKGRDTVVVDMPRYYDGSHVANFIPHERNATKATLFWTWSGCESFIGNLIDLCKSTLEIAKNGWRQNEDGGWTVPISTCAYTPFKMQLMQTILLNGYLAVRKKRLPQSDREYISEYMRHVRIVARALNILISDNKDKCPPPLHYDEDGNIHSGSFYPEENQFILPIHPDMRDKWSRITKRLVSHHHMPPNMISTEIPRKVIERWARITYKKTYWTQLQPTPEPPLPKPRRSSVITCSRFCFTPNCTNRPLDDECHP